MNRKPLTKKETTMTKAMWTRWPNNMYDWNGYWIYFTQYGAGLFKNSVKIGTYCSVEEAKRTAERNP